MALQNTDLLPLWRITDSSSRKISVADFATSVSPKPGREGSFVVVEDDAGVVSFSEIIDGGTY